MPTPVFLTPRRRMLPVMLASGFVFLASGCTAPQETATEAGPALRPLSPDYAVSAQLHPSDMRRIARQGYNLVINNRPDGESPDQPASAAMARAASKAGLAYFYFPVRHGHYSRQELRHLDNILAGHKGKILAFCRTGIRATTLWAMAQTERGAIGPDAAVRAAKTVGVNLEGQRKRLEALAPPETRND